MANWMVRSTLPNLRLRMPPGIARMFSQTPLRVSVKVFRHPVGGSGMRSAAEFADSPW
jgi:hypothetical protein